MNFLPKYVDLRTFVVKMVWFAYTRFFELNQLWQCKDFETSSIFGGIPPYLEEVSKSLQLLSYMTTTDGGTDTRKICGQTDAKVMTDDPQGDPGAETSEACVWCSK